MNWATELVRIISGLELSPNYAYIFLAFILFTIGFVLWAFYYAIFKGAIKELTNISWLSFKDTVTYTTISIVVIVIFSTLLFLYDFILDQLVNIIIQYANTK